jgi:hypothetical protein
MAFITLHVFNYFNVNEIKCRFLIFFPEDGRMRCNRPNSGAHVMLLIITTN